MWLLAPDCTWWFSLDKKTRLRLRQAKISELEQMQAQKMDGDQRQDYLLSIGIVEAEGLCDHEGKQIDIERIRSDGVLPVDLCRRFPNEWRQKASAEIAWGPKQDVDEGN